MSDTSIKQFLYLATKNLFGLKISREEFEQSKDENFDLSENLKCIFDKQNRKIINTEDLNTVNGKNQFIERENFNKELNSNVFDYNYVSQFNSSVGQIVSPKPQIFDSITSESSSEEKRIFNDSEDYTPIILKSTSTSETTQEIPSDLTQTPIILKSTLTPEIIQKTPSDLPQTPTPTQQSSIIPIEEKRDFNNLEDNAPIILKPSPNPEVVQETPSDLVQTPIPTQAPTQQPPIIPTDQTEQESPKPNDETLNFSINTTDSEDKKDSLNSNHANHYYKSLVNNVFPSFDINSENPGHNMEGGENEMFEDQKASILEEAKAYQTTQSQSQTVPVTKQDNIKLDDEINEIFTPENSQKEDLILDSKNETKQLNLEKPLEIKKVSETEKEVEDKINTIEEKKQDDNIKDVEPEEVNEETKDNINIASPDNEKQNQEENNLNTPSFLESNIIKGGELPPDSSISQNTQNIILNAFNELTEKKKNNLF